MTSRRLDLLYGVIFAGITGWLFWVSIETGVNASRIANDPMWYPQLLLTLLMACSVALIVRGVRRKTRDAVTAPGWRPLAVALVLTSAYLLAFQSIGFVPSTLLLIPLMSWLLGFRRVLPIVLVTIMFTAVVWYGFHYGFNATPPGIELPT